MATSVGSIHAGAWTALGRPDLARCVRTDALEHGCLQIERGAVHVRELVAFFGGYGTLRCPKYIYKFRTNLVHQGAAFQRIPHAR